jgi:hypothetical protein
MEGNVTTAAVCEEVQYEITDLCSTLLYGVPILFSGMG